MIPLLDAKQMQALDRYAIDTVGIPGPVLMETAGRGVFEALLEHYGEQALAGNTVVACGKGNNGGDGFVIARYLLNRGCDVVALLAGCASDVTGDARLHMEAYLACGGELAEGSEEAAKRTGLQLAEADLVVDALFGTGLSRSVEGVAARWIGWIDAARGPVVAVDLPSGVSGDTGQVLGDAVHADLTVTFGHYKRGHFLRPGASLCGELVLVDIGIPPMALSQITPELFALTPEDFIETLRRDDSAHKGEFGHLAVIAGGEGKMGAAALATLAALRAGAGLVTAVFPAGLTNQARFAPEVMTLRLGDETATDWDPALLEELARELDAFDALVLGPGMGTGEGALGFFQGLLETEELPALVIDADALNLLARTETTLERTEAVLTPHPGEAARLLALENHQVQGDRVAAARALAQRYGATALLKGAGTLIAEARGPMRLVPGGNPGMATAGAGDVLTGVVGAMAARGLPAAWAANLGGYVHGLAGDLAASHSGMEGLIASDILEALPEVLQQLAGN